MIVLEKPLWEGNKKGCMYVCTNPMNVGRPQKLGGWGLDKRLS